MALTERLYGSCNTLSELRVCKEISGLGMSEWEGYANRLSELFEFTNTFYHQQPLLNIANTNSSSNYKNLDFVICSEVFEHIDPPISLGFANLSGLLKPGGILIFSVPYVRGAATQEHFPGLFQYKLLELGGEWILVNKTTSGEYNMHRHLLFHGGPGSVLELRIFDENDLVEALSASGFRDIKIHNTACLETGYCWFAGAKQNIPYQGVDYGYVISAVKAGG